MTLLRSNTTPIICTCIYRVNIASSADRNLPPPHGVQTMLKLSRLVLLIVAFLWFFESLLKGGFASSWVYMN